MSQEAPERKYRVTYARKGVAAYVSHLDCMTTLIRAIRRSGLPYMVTHGCHVRPKVSLGPSLPLGHSSACEVLDVVLREAVSVEKVTDLLQVQMSSGFEILSVVEIPLKHPPLPSDGRFRYRLHVKTAAVAVQEKMKAFLQDPARVIRAGKPGEEKDYALAGAVVAVPEADSAAGPVYDFLQGKPGLPSASKVIGALIEHLGDERDAVLEIERLAFLQE
jgi:radical SAM-linked protein